MKIIKKVVRMGIDLGKNMFHLFGVDQSGSKVVKKKLRCKQMLEYFGIHLATVERIVRGAMQ